MGFILLAIVLIIVAIILRSQETTLLTVLGIYFPVLIISVIAFIVSLFYLCYPYQMRMYQVDIDTIKQEIIDKTSILDSPKNIEYSTNKTNEVNSEVISKASIIDAQTRLYKKYNSRAHLNMWMDFHYKYWWLVPHFVPVPKKIEFVN